MNVYFKNWSDYPLTVLESVQWSFIMFYKVMKRVVNGMVGIWKLWGCHFGKLTLATVHKTD